MPKSPRRNPKLDDLRQQGLLNNRPDAVVDPLFNQHEFFDPHDLLQVKYEMLRRVETGEASVAEAAASFGVSRPTFYQAKGALAQRGLAGLLPRKRGPRGPHKLREEVVRFVDARCEEDPSLRASDLVLLVKKRFGLEVHPRSIERSQRRQKKRQESA